jgi:hypothetical protein
LEIQPSNEFLPVKTFLTSALLFFSWLSFAQSQIEVQNHFNSAIKYLINTQTDSTITGKQYAGEWPVYMELTEPYFIIGRRQKALDSDCFTLSAIHNFLAETYLLDTSQSELKPVLEKAYEEIKTYATGLEYNFWKPLPALRNHKLFGNLKKAPLVRRPTNFHLNNRLIMKMTNVTNDADDTNQANLATYYHNRIFQDSITIAEPKVFENWIDKKRQNRNWYNYLFHTKKNSGAYLTWLNQEHQYGIWNPGYSLLGILGIFLPTSVSNPKAYQPWIPWGTNDVDPIVNANILTYLGATEQLEQNDINEAAAKMITEMCSKEMWGTAGVYYPNAYHLPYAVARAYKNGSKNLKVASQKCADYLHETQQNGGFYMNRSWVNNGDTIQSTAYALHAMLDLKESGFEIEEQLISKTIHYLLAHSNKSADGTYWNGGVYFTGGTALRNIIQWHSDAYTTALIAGSLQRVLVQFPELLEL